MRIGPMVRAGFTYHNVSQRCLEQDTHAVLLSLDW